LLGTYRQLGRHLASLLISLVNLAHFPELSFRRQSTLSPSAGEMKRCITSLSLGLKLPSNHRQGWLHPSIVHAWLSILMEINYEQATTRFNRIADRTSPNNPAK
jgi:hypothetical protein